ncbi:MAG TPA: DUF72 domain-containing protein [Rhodopila sp.]|jgi:uncharacterized protein YecE (DUF72 family)|nr:DUF72 domain-containing protein [Rhodopila sp.]
MAGIIRVGVAGWTYAPWRGAFYPGEIRREQELGYAASRFRVLEINDTFYGPLRPEMFAGWMEQVPADFVFAVKAPRQITHVLRLRDAGVALANFLASGLLRLEAHLGPILWQLPPNLRFDPVGMQAFLKMLPHDTGHAAMLGRAHDRSLRGAAWLEVATRRPMRHAIEVWHESYRCPAFIELLRAHDVGLVCADRAGWAPLMDVTAGFVYCRLLGVADGVGGQGYDHAALQAWSRRLKAWAGGEEPADALLLAGRDRPRRRDVFVVFDSARKLRAPANALELVRRLRA